VFGLERTIMAGHRLTGWNAIRSRADALGRSLGEEQLRALTAEVKRRADTAPLADDELDDLIRGWVPA
jgi:homocitrate synthase